MAEFKSNHYPETVYNDNHRRIDIIVYEMTVSANIDNLIARIKEIDSLKSVDTFLVESVDKSISYITKVIKSQEKMNGKKFNNATETLWACALPLPNELNENQSHQWNTTEGFIGATLGGLADTNIAGGLSVSKVIGETASRANNRKALVNPGYFQDYRGTEPRRFNFTWDLIPNSKAEAEQIFEILTRLKKYTLPTLGGTGLSLRSPYLFDIIIGNKNINAVMNMNNVVCTNMGIGYSADNSLQMMGDGTPKHMTLSMEFMERSTVFASDYPE